MSGDEAWWADTREWLVAYATTRGAQEPEETAQEALCRFLASGATARPGGEHRASLCSLTNGLLANERRMAQRRARLRGEMRAAVGEWGASRPFDGIARSERAQLGSRVIGDVGLELRARRDTVGRLALAHALCGRWLYPSLRAMASDVGLSTSTVYSGLGRVAAHVARARSEHFTED